MSTQQHAACITVSTRCVAHPTAYLSRHLVHLHSIILLCKQRAASIVIAQGLRPVHP